MIEFLAMNGYAGYVWASYGLTLLVMAGLVWWTLFERNKARMRLDRIAAREARESLKGDNDLPRGDAPDADKTGHSL